MSKVDMKADFSVAFEQLRQRFAAGLSERTAAMVNLAEQAGSDKALKELIAQAHKLAGACGTFGYAVLGNQARQIEQLAIVISEKDANEREQSLPSLKRAVLELDIAVASAQQSKTQSTELAQFNLAERNSVWLLLDDKDVATELTQQLTAFGHKVESFTNFDSCIRRLQQAAPAVMFSAVSLRNGGSLFQQNYLLNQLAKQQCRIMLYSSEDGFEVRIKAAHLHADAFFTAPIDISSVISSAAELLEQVSDSAGKVFIVDDDKLLAEHFALVLSAQGIETRILENVKHLIDELVRFQPDMLLMDIYMPEYSGMDLAGLIRLYPSLRRLPIVFLSSEENKQLQLIAMAHGADDFISKPVDDVQLVQLVKVRLQRSKQLKNLIEKDSLTALVKHSAIKEVAALEFERSGRNQQPLSIVMLDIDRFKAVNDNYGHATGDMVITALATLLRKRIRKTDRAGRYGGEEFLLVLPNCNSKQAATLVENILVLFRTLQFSAEHKTFSCSFSAGISSTEDMQYSNAEQIIAAADEALYRAKDNGRDQVCCYRQTK